MANTRICPSCIDGIQHTMTDEGEESSMCWTCLGTGQAPCDDAGNIIYFNGKQESVNPEKFAKEWIKKLGNI